MSPTSEFDGLPIPRRYWSVVAIALAAAMAMLDSSIANLALPSIAADIGASESASIWIINSYQLVMTVLLLPLSAVGDRIGYQRVYKPSLVLFVLGSLACALSRNLEMLVASRVLQGIGGAGIMSITPAMVRATYPSHLLGRGIGINSLVLSVAAASGPMVAAAILSIASWPWLFALNIPLGIAALVLGWRNLPASPGHGHEPHYLSAVLSIITVGSLVVGCELTTRGELSRGLPLLALTAMAGSMLVRRERARAEPLLPLDLLRVPLFSLSIATSMITFAAQMIAFVTLPFLFQSVFGRDALHVGLLLTVWPIAIAIVAPVAGILSDRHHPGVLGGIGLTILAIGLLLMSLLGVQQSTVASLMAMALCGAGFGLSQAPNNRTIISATPRHRSGAAGGMLGTARVLGQTLGAVIVAAGFHWAGVGASPLLLRIAALAAVMGATTSLLRLRTGPTFAPQP